MGNKYLLYTQLILPKVCWKSAPFASWLYWKWWEAVLPPGISRIKMAIEREDARIVQEFLIVAAVPTSISMKICVSSWLTPSIYWDSIYILRVQRMWFSLFPISNSSIQKWNTSENSEVLLMMSGHAFLGWGCGGRGGQLCSVVGARGPCCPQNAVHEERF